MKNFILILFICLVIPGCGSSFKSEMANIPDISFDSMEYHRAGNFTSFDLEAINSKVDGCTNEIELLKIKADYGMAVNFNIEIKGYKRELKDCKE